MFLFAAASADSAVIEEVERIEVLCGPQDTLYGSGSMFIRDLLVTIDGTASSRACCRNCRRRCAPNSEGPLARTFGR